MLSLDDLGGGVFNSIPALFTTSGEMTLLELHSQEGSILPPGSTREVGLFCDIWNGPGTSQQYQLDDSTYNPPQLLPVPETGDIAAGAEVAPKPQRRRRDLVRSSVRKNPYGRSGTLRCELCRHW